MTLVQITSACKTLMLLKSLLTENPNDFFWDYTLPAIIGIVDNNYC